MRNQEWIRTLEDGGMVKFIYQTALGGGSFVTAQIAANDIVFSILLTKAKKNSARLNTLPYFAPSTILCAA